MAFSTRRYLKHIDKYGVTHRIEIQEDGFVGSESSISTTGQVFTFEHETHAGEDKEILNVYENPVQKGSLEVDLLIQNSTDRTLITDIFEGDEDDFRLVWKRDGTIFWTGTILNDMLEYPESDYPYMAKLWAKDFSRLQGVDYSLDDTRQTLITTFADLIGNLGYSLDIETHTSWTTEDTTDATDFLQQIYHETKALRNFARTGDESDTTITVFEALQMMCRNFGCVLRQEGGLFKIIQYSAYEDPSAVNVTVYDSTGTEKTAATSTDLSLDASSNDITITDRSITRAFKAIRRARNKFDHRSSVSFIKFEQEITLDSGTTSQSESQLIISDGSQTLTLEADIEADIPNNESNGRVQWRIQAGSYYWDEDNTQWTATTTTNETDLNFVGPGAQEDPANNELWIGDVTVKTTELPSDADGTLTVTIMRALSDAVFADETRWIDTAFNIQNAVSSENSTSIDYVLTQSGGYSSVFELDPTWFGDGPTGYVPSALRHGSSDADFTSDTWQRRGTTTGYRNFHENLLKEIIDLQRGNRIRTDGQILGADYDPEKIIAYRSKNLAYTGGAFDGEAGDWKPVLFEINIVTGTDTFEDLPKFTDETGSGTGSTGGSSGGLDQSTADARYFKQASLLSEASDLPTLRGNIGLGASDDVEFNNVALPNNSYYRVDNSSGTEIRIAGISSNDNVYLGAIDSAGGKTIIREDGSDVITLDSGRVGISEDTPTAALHITSNESTGIRLEATSPLVEFRETDQTLPAGLWRYRIGSDMFLLEKNTAAVGDYSTRITALSIASDGGLTIPDTLTINSQLLFTAGNEQLLSTDASPTFAGGTFNGSVFQKVGFARGTGSSSINMSDNTNNMVFRTGGVNALLLNADQTATFENDITARDGFFTRDDTAIAEIIGLDGTGVVFGSDTPHDVLLRRNNTLKITIGSASTEFEDNIKDSSFTEGWAGTNWQITEAGDAEVESLRVRGALRVYEFIAKQLSSIGGTEILSIANGRIESVDTGAGTITVDNVDGTANTSFKADDLWIVQVVDVNNDLESGGTGSIVKQVRGSVTSVSGATLTVSVDAGSADGLADLEQGDLIVAYGSSSDTNRQAVMYRNVDRSEDNLIMRLQTGVDAFADLTATANTAVAYGDLNGYLGIGSEEFGFFAGDPSGNYILATENQVKAILDDINLDVVGSGSSGYGNADFFLDAGNHQLSLGDVFQADGGAGTGSLVGFNFGTSQLESSNLSGGGDGSFTTDGILINSGGYISAPAFYLSSTGGGALGDLDISGTLTMGASGEITNASGNYVIDSDGIELINTTTGQFNASTIRFTNNTNDNLLIYSFNTGSSRIESRDDLIFRRGSTPEQIMALRDTQIQFDKPIVLNQLTETERDNISSPTTGSVIYNLTTDRPNYYNGTNWVNF